MHNSDQKIANIAEKIMRYSKITNDQKFGEIMAILMIISIILTTIRVLQECNKKQLNNLSCQDKPIIYGELIKNTSKKRTWFTRRRIKKIIASKMCKEDYIKYSAPLTEAILMVGENVTEDDVVTLVEKANV